MKYTIKQNMNLLSELHPLQSSGKLLTQHSEKIIKHFLKEAKNFDDLLNN